MDRIKVNLTLDVESVEAARMFGLNTLRLAEAAIAEAARAERNRVWREANKAAINAEEVAREGLPLARFRRFQGAGRMSQFDLRRL